jgi:hypothetical protein
MEGSNSKITVRRISFSFIRGRDETTTARLLLIDVETATAESPPRIPLPASHPY